MGNTATLGFQPATVEGKPVQDPGANFIFFRAPDQKEFFRDSLIPLPNQKMYSVPAFPQIREMFCDIEATRFRTWRSPVLTPTSGQSLTLAPTFFRDPSHWKARFDRYDSLPAPFAALKTILGNSPALRVKDGPNLGLFTGATYDDVDDDTKILAKTSLLNLFQELTFWKAPFETQPPWFSFVRRLLAIDRERFIAIADPKANDFVRRISDNIGQFPDYERTAAFNHRGNIPPEYSVHDMVSIKSKDENGNIQLTTSRVSDAQNNNLVILDADIDENGKLLEHLADLLHHKITGGTHPFYIHEWVVLRFGPAAPLGYVLV